MNSVLLSSPIALDALQNKPVSMSFDGGTVSSDAGVLLLKDMERSVGILKAMAETLTDGRDQRYVKHCLNILLKQRVFQICTGYEDANDCNRLRNDPIFKMCADVLPETGRPLASQPTMSRFENTPSRSDLYRLAYAFVDSFMNSYPSEPKSIILDFDDTEDIVHGHQQLALFNNYIGEYCFLPLHIYEGTSGKLVSTILKPGKRLTGKQLRAILKRVIQYLRTRWKKTKILVRGDSHFAVLEVMEWLAAQPNTSFVFGLASNSILQQYAESAVQSAKIRYEQQKKKVKVYHSFRYRAGTWGREFRVIVKVELSPEHPEPNIRFIVTKDNRTSATTLYSNTYCARGNAELFIKDHKTYLKSDRTSCHGFAANQFRLFLHSAAYVLLHALQAAMLRTKAWKRSTMHTLQLNILKLGARVKEWKTRITVVLPTACPAQEVIRSTFAHLRC